MKQIGLRYRVRQDPKHFGFWCVIDRYYLRNLFNYANSLGGYCWNTSLVIQAHWRSYDDALEFVRLLEAAE